MEARPPYDLWGSLDTPTSPVVLSVAHAGRDYPLALRRALRVPIDALAALEDRYVDLVACGARGTETLLVQRAPRAWIDLNRAEHERDPRLEDSAQAERQPISSAKIRSGLGLVPRRTPGAGDIWRHRLSAADVQGRIAQAHRPYHAALARVLNAARARFGVAILLDLHSMPTPPSGVRIVVGDRFGRAAAGRFVQRVETEAAASGYAVATNAPYAGGHILDLHGRPRDHIHAIQLELDRALYLDRHLAEPGPGLSAAIDLVRRTINALADETGAATLAQAAE